MRRYIPIYRLIIFVLAITIGSIELSALPLEHYAANSLLSEGKWVKIKVTEDGMQYLSNKQLQEMGFSDPSKVNVFGYGGRIISEILDENQPDDLPCQPVIRTADGIYFYGVNSIDWDYSVSIVTNYVREQNQYSNDSYYFLSDRAVTQKEMQKAANTTIIGATEYDYFIERILHEKELAAPANTGAVLLGEDFRTNNSQTFSFALPDHINDTIDIEVCFAAKTTSGKSSITYKANGTQLKASPSDALDTSVGDTHMATKTSRKTIDGIDERLDLQINYSCPGVIYMARLDYIKIEYKRELKLTETPLYFYSKITNKDNIVYTIKNCDESTIIWDVTDPHNPKTVEFTVYNGIARFSPDKRGFKEYIAFNPNKIKSSLTPTFVCNIENQNIHAMPVPDMVIITPEEFKSQAQRIADLHTEVDSMLVYVITPDKIYNEFSSGVQDFSAYRKMLKMWWDRSDTEEHKLGYCLLFGRPSYDNRGVTDKVKQAGYPRIPIWQSESSLSEAASYSTDDLIGMLKDGTSAFDMTKETLSIAVGRMPVKSVKEATQMVDKLIKYVKEPNLGAWRNNVMIIADDEDDAVHLDQSQTVFSTLRKNGNGQHFIYERLYLDAYPLGTSGTGKSYPQAKERMLKMFDEGVMFVDFIGHANPSSWTHEGLLNYTDILNMSNKNLMFMLTATCEFTRWDSDDISGAEILWLHPNSGVIGMISATRKVYISDNGTLNKATASSFFERDEDGKPKRVGDIYKEGKNKDTTQSSNSLKFMLMADPAMRLPSPEYNIVIDQIDSLNIATIEDEARYPVIPARGRVLVKGRVTDASGNTMTDFNGIAVPTLFDAERVIETFGHGQSGQKRIYNDRKNKLFTGNVPVTNGEWEVTILMPSEIDNNYSPALLNVYAYSDTGMEANGSTEKLYVYGWNEDATEDLEGPEISLLALNSELFADGDVVNPSPLLLARFRDDSGINISTSGIGHQITATIDGKKVYDDLIDYYQSDISDYTMGSIAYPLNDLEAGEHTLKFTVWDNANNSSSKEISFNVSKNATPQISDISTNVNPASTDVTFYIYHNMPSEALSATIDVYDLGGKRVWTSDASASSQSRIEINWDLNDLSGNRVQRGIYLYKATIKTSEGSEVTKTKKLAVTAQ